MVFIPYSGRMRRSRQLWVAGDWLKQKLVEVNYKNVSLASLWYHTKCNKIIKNPIISFACRIVNEIHKQLKMNGLFLPSCPIWNNLALKAGGKPISNESWQEKNITNLGHILGSNGEMLSFNELKKKFGLNNSDTFQYLQIKSIMQSFANIMLADNDSFDIKFRDAVSGSGKVSKIYKLLCCTSSCISSKVIKAQWEKDLGINLTSEQWETILRRSNNLSKCVRYKIIQIKILFRSYITPHKLKKMNNGVTDKCWHGCGMNGTLIHLLWHCPETQTFWLKIRDYLCKLFKINFPLEPAVGLLGKQIEGATTKKIQYLLDLAFLSAKRLILMNWKVKKPNCFDIVNWQKDFLELVSMEQAASVLQDLGSDHTDSLSQIMSLLKENQIDEDIS